jgi:NAD+ synthase
VIGVEGQEKKIVSWIRQKVGEAKAKGVVVGLSGGIDSSVVAVLCKKAFPDTIQGVILPCGSNPEDREHAELVAKRFGIPFEMIDLEESYKTFFKSTSKEDYNSEKHDGLAVVVVGTDNKSEEMIGYFTKYGDGGVDILPIVNLLKRDVRKMAKHLGINEEIIKKKPSAGLWHGQTDEEEMGIGYDELDEILDRLEKGNDLKDIETEKVNKVKRMIASSDHKRQMPPGCKF